MLLQLLVQSEYERKELLQPDKNKAVTRVIVLNFYDCFNNSMVPKGNYAIFSTMIQVV